jgi:hypothetical protein
MARATGLSPEQLRALDRLKSIRGVDRFYLAGGAAIAFHLRHRRSDDLDLFGPPKAAFQPFQSLAREHVRSVEVLAVSDATLRLRIGRVPVDVVRYPYPLLERPVPGPRGFRVPTLLDLATMKLAAAARRGLARDFWDLYAIAQSGISLEDMSRAYVERFALAEGDLYHVWRALIWFDDAESEKTRPAGMKPALWKKIRAFFEAEVPRLLV